MKKVDLEIAIPSEIIDRKVAGESVAAGENQPENPPDLPPESFWLSKDAEFDWFDRNAFLDRRESTKGNANSTTSSNSNPNSQRFSTNLKSKASSIIGLPKNQKTCFADVKFRRNNKPATAMKLFPKRTRSNKKSSVPASEPSSPKVSCMGRVRSKRDRSRRVQNNQHSSEPVKIEPKPVRKNGFCTAGFWTGCCGGKSRVVVNAPPTEVVEPPRKSVTVKAREVSFIEPVVEAPGLGGMNRFASGRRSASWDVDEITLDMSKS